MIQVLSDPRYGSNLSQVEATVKKHEAIKVDIMTRVSFNMSSICTVFVIFAIFLRGFQTVGRTIQRFA